MPGYIKRCHIGIRILEVFLASTTVIVLAMIFGLYTDAWDPGADPVLWVFVLAGLFLVELVLFWIGIIMVYISSLQLGIRTRVIGILCGWIPLINLLVLITIIRICRKEVTVEKKLALRDQKRESLQVCRTKYPILLVHGVFFRDSERLNYWGRIPEELK